MLRLIIAVLICLSFSCVVRAEPLFDVILHGKWGYIDRQGQVRIPCLYDECGFFNEDRAPVCVGNRWGVLDGRGRMVIKPTFEQLGFFSQGRCAFRAGKKWGFIDASGKVVLPATYTSCQAFHESRALVEVGDQDSTLNKYGFVDLAGRLVIPAIWDWPTSSFSDGLSMAVSGGRSGFIDKGGRSAIPAQYDTTYPFDGGHTLASREMGGFYSVIDKTGKALPTHYTRATTSFSEGLAPVQVAEDQWGFIDARGVLRLKAHPHESPPFSLLVFSEGLSAVKPDGKGDRWGYRDRTGKLVIPARFDQASSFNNGAASVRMGEKWGWIDRSGRYFWRPTQ